MIIFHSSVNIICDGREENYYEPGSSNNLLGSITTGHTFSPHHFYFGVFQGGKGAILEISVSIKH